MAKPISVTADLGDFGICTLTLKEIRICLQLKEVKNFFNIRLRMRRNMINAIHTRRRPSHSRQPHGSSQISTRCCTCTPSHRKYHHPPIRTKALSNSLMVCTQPKVLSCTAHTDHFGKWTYFQWSRWNTRARAKTRWLSLVNVVVDTANRVEGFTRPKTTSFHIYLCVISLWIELIGWLIFLCSQFGHRLM